VAGLLFPDLNFKRLLSPVVVGYTLVQKCLNLLCRSVFLNQSFFRNLQDRETQRNSEPDPLDGQMLWVLWRHIRRAERRRREAAAARGEEEAGSGEESEEEDDDSDGEEGPRGRMCTQS